MPEPFAYFLRQAEPYDAPAIASLVEAAYGPYVARIGRKPGPMLEDYSQVIRERQVIVAESSGMLVGVLVLASTKDGFLLQNIAARPARLGIGKALLQHAESEARRQGFSSIHLYTHEQMTENRRWYSCARVWNDMLLRRSLMALGAMALLLAGQPSSAQNEDAAYVEGLSCRRGPFAVKLPRSYAALRRLSRLQREKLLQTTDHGDFMVPVLDKQSRFRALADERPEPVRLRHRFRRLGIALVTFDRAYLPRLMATPRGPYLKENMTFMKGGLGA